MFIKHRTRNNKCEELLLVNLLVDYKLSTIGVEIK